MTLLMDQKCLLLLTTSLHLIIRLTSTYDVTYGSKVYSFIDTTLSKQKTYIYL